MGTLAYILVYGWGLAGVVLVDRWLLTGLGMISECVCVGIP
jgi:hypothetical protein